jgi:hypothetical protein
MFLCLALTAVLNLNYFYFFVRKKRWPFNDANFYQKSLNFSVILAWRLLGAIRNIFNPLPHNYHFGSVITITNPQCSVPEFRGSRLSISRWHSVPYSLLHLPLYLPGIVWRFSRMTSSIISPHEMHLHPKKFSPGP